MPTNMLPRSYNCRMPNISQKHQKHFELCDSSAYCLAVLHCRQAIHHITQKTM